MNESAILELVNSQTFAVWFLAGAALVFWMQAGFAMVETGFTRAKNAGNIIMKNLMDFCIGTVVFIPLGFGLLFGEDLMGLIGKPGLDIFTSYSSFDWSNFVFNLVFCATTATIVSGAMAERTKFLSYCLYSAVISALIYPIEAHWIWGSGWLARQGFHDFAGSCAIHMVGGISALIGAYLLGPRIGKFRRKGDGTVEVHSFPGHNLPLGALGVFILWLGWYGFNGAAATSVEQLGSIFLTTTVAPAIATVTCMIFTWVKYGKPDVSMCLNASLAGLVGITAPCDTTDCLGAVCVGLVSGLLVCFGVWLLDYKLHIDDPVGAVAVHMLNGIWGTLAVGLFSTTSAPGNDSVVGFFYGGGFRQLGMQVLGVLSVGVWTAAAITVTFLVIRATIGLRASAEEELTGLDITEHGLPSAYDGFDIHDHSAGADTTVPGTVSVNLSVPVEQVHQSTPAISGASYGAFTKIVIICRQNKFEALRAALAQINVTGMTVIQVMGCGNQKGRVEYYRGVPITMSLHPKLKVEVVVSTVPVEQVVAAAKMALYTGNVGDGKIFIYNVENVVRVRTGEEGFDALANEVPTPKT
jgi:Amt family ammonium transporter